MSDGLSSLLFLAVYSDLTKKSTTERGGWRRTTRTNEGNAVRGARSNTITFWLGVSYAFLLTRRSDGLAAFSNHPSSWSVTNLNHITTLFCTRYLTYAPS